MSKSKRPESENPRMIRATHTGRVDTQAERDAQAPHKADGADQSEGAKADGQTTAMQGRGAGFSRNVH